MNSTVSSYITSAGLQAVTSAGVYGPYFAIKYFIPFYDYRIDKTISRGENNLTSAISISSLNLVSATSNTLFGEKLFANGDYSLSQNKFLFWKSSMGSLSAGNQVNVPSSQSVSTDVNLQASKPLSVVVSGTNFTSPTPGFFNISGATTISGTNLSTFNPLSGAAYPLSAFYRVASYSPIANGLTSASGEFNCRIPPAPGSFKFNGLALYAVKVDANGFDDSGNGTSFVFNPTLFGVILFDQAQYKQDTDGGINDFSISVNLGFDWNIASSGTNNTPVYIETNYWKKLPTSTTTSAYGLNYDGDIVISSSAVAGSWTPRAKLTVTDNQKQQLRLAYDNTRFTDFTTIRFPKNLVGPFPNSDDRAVLSIDTSCPDDSLLQLGYKTSATGIKSVAIGCYSSATGYLANDFTDSDPITTTSGGYTVAIGVQNLAAGFGSIATGYATSSLGYLNFAGGDHSIASYNPNLYHYTNPDNTPKDGLNFSFGKYTSAISRDSEAYNFDYFTLGSFTADDESYGSNVSFGVRNLSKGGLSFTHGSNVSALGVGAFGLGTKNIALGHFSFVAGVNSFANSDLSFTYGYNVSSYSPFGFGYGRNILLGNSVYNTNSTFNLGIGENISATNFHSIAIGSYSLSTGTNSISIGQNYSNPNQQMYTIATEKDTISMGQGTSAIGIQSISIGHFSLASNSQSMVYGYQCMSNGNYSLATGYNTVSNGYASFAGNSNTSALGFYSTSFGNYTLSNGDASLSLGDSTSASGYGSIAGGYMSNALGNYSLAFGKFAKTKNESTIALGESSNALFDRSIAIGYNSTATDSQQVMIGSCNTKTVIKGSTIQIGQDCNTQVTIPGISQFNDSIKVGIRFEQDGADLAYSPRKLTINLIRAGNSNTLVLLETGYNSNQFTVKSVDSDKFKCVMFNYNNVANDNRLYDITSTNGFVLYADSRILPGDVNLAISYDKFTSDIVLKSLGNSLVFTTSYSKYTQTSDYFVKNIIYSGRFDNNNGSDTDSHIFYWIPNVNVIDTTVNYDKIDCTVATTLNANPTVGDGICAYNLTNRTITGSDKSAIYFSGFSVTPPTLELGGGGGQTLSNSGMFINSGNMSIACQSITNTGT